MRTGTSRSERGQVEVVPLGVLVVVVGTLLVANAWAVVDAKQTAASAAREAARAFVESGDAGAADHAARAAADAAARGGGRSPEELHVERRAGSFQRCSRVTFEARTEVPAIGLPWIDRTLTTVVVRARHSEIVDPYRSGLPAGGSCG